MGTCGFIGDVHGDIDALQWALEQLSDVDTIVCLGDVVDGPRDAACIALLQERNVVVLQGNHDFWASRPGGGVGNARTDAEREWLAALPRRRELDGILAYHSRYDVEGSEAYWEYLDHERAIRKALEEAPHATLIVCGHTHIPAVNVLRPDGSIVYVSTPQLQQRPRLELQARHRYVVNAGRPTNCIMRCSRDAETAFVEFRFKSVLDRATSPPAQDGIWRRLRRWLGRA